MERVFTYLFEFYFFFCIPTFLDILTDILL